MSSQLDAPTREPVSWAITRTPDSDYEKWAAAELSAFHGTDNLMHDIMNPPPATEASVTKFASHLREAAENEPDNVHTVQIKDPETGEIAGGARWLFYPTDANSYKMVPFLNTEDGEDGEEKQRMKQFSQWAMDEFFGRRVRRPKGPHAQLDILYCNPKYTRRGIASALTEYGCRIADEMGVIAFVEGSVQGKPVYERKGFVVTEPVNQRWDGWPEHDPIVWFQMERQPVKAT